MAREVVGCGSKGTLWQYRAVRRSLLQAGVGRERCLIHETSLLRLTLGAWHRPGAVGKRGPNRAVRMDPHLETWLTSHPWLCSTGGMVWGKVSHRGAPCFVVWTWPRLVNQQHPPWVCPSETPAEAAMPPELGLGVLHLSWPPLLEEQAGGRRPLTHTGAPPGPTGFPLRRATPSARCQLWRESEQ